MSTNGLKTLREIIALQNKFPEPEEDHARHDWLPPLHRCFDCRDAVRLFSLSAVAAIAGCGSDISATGSSTTTGTTATTTTLSASLTTPAQGVSVTLTAVVSPSAATGTVTFYDGTTALGTATLSSGMTTLAVTFTTTGTHTLTAIYSGSSTYATSTSSSVTITVSASSTCATATLEGEEGPYFVDDSATGYNRSNILSNLDGTDTQTGIPFALAVYVYDSKNSCAAMQNVQIDIWHCNASGIYSAESVESTVGQSWLRGYQVSDVNGMVTFNTIIPGWYSGRTTHIHMRFRSTYDSTDTGGTNTMQVFFDQTLIDILATSVSPYNAEGTNPTTNVGDHVYTGEEEATTLLTLTGSNADGYAATFKCYMPI